jgi:hypothetical protein
MKRSMKVSARVLRTAHEMAKEGFAVKFAGLWLRKASSVT